MDVVSKLMEEVEALRARKVAAQAKLVLSSAVADDEARRMGANPSQKLRVCDICGALLSIHDSDQYVIVVIVADDCCSCDLTLMCVLVWLAGDWRIILAGKSIWDTVRPVRSWSN